MSKKDFDMSVLSDFFHEILSSTSEVKNILEFECNEARYVLQACTIETFVEKEVDEECCTCDYKSSMEDHAKEIVDGIGRALGQAQELREKIAANISKQKRKSREPDLETIYMPSKKIVPKKFKSTEQQRKTIKSTDPKNKTPSEISSELTAGKTFEFKSEVKTEKTEFKSATVTRRKLPQLSAGNSMASAKAPTTKDFVAANKCNIKHLQRNSKSTLDMKLAANFTKQSRDLSPLSGTSEALSGCATSIAQLNDLMTKVSFDSIEKESSVGDNKNADCPCHGLTAKKMVKKRVISTIDLMEGLDRYGIPAPILRILKAYHSYTSKKHSTNESAEKRCKRAADKFLTALDSLNEKRDAEGEPALTELADLTVSFASIFRQLYEAGCDLNDRAIDETTARYADLDLRGKSCPLRKYEGRKFRKTTMAAVPFSCSSRGWSANGVWYRHTADSFPRVAGIHCIRYANRRQLMTFFELNQRLQLLLYHGDLIELLLSHVLPNVRECFDNSSADYSEAYKMIFTLAQVINPRVPTLVRTDV